MFIRKRHTKIDRLETDILFGESPVGNYYLTLLHNCGTGRNHVSISYAGLFSVWGLNGNCISGIGNKKRLITSLMLIINLLSGVGRD